MKFLKRLLVDYWGRRADDFHWRKAQRPLDPARIEGVCILHLNNKLGDAVIDVRIVDAFRRLHPNMPVTVGTTAPFARFWESHPHVRQVVLFPSTQGRSALGRVPAARRAAGPWRKKFDLVVSFEAFAQPDHFAMLRALAPKFLVGFYKNHYRLFDYSLDEARHGVIVRPIGTKIESIMRVLGDEIDVATLDSHIPFGPDEEQEAKSILERLDLPGDRLFLHVHGTSDFRVISPGTTARLVRSLREAGHHGPIWLSVPKGESQAYRGALEETERGVAILEPTCSFYSLFALLDKMDSVVATDTSVGHIAAALQKPQIALFSGEANTPLVWRPMNVRCVSVIAAPERPVDAIDLAEFFAAVHTLRNWLSAAKEDSAG